MTLLTGLAACSGPMLTPLQASYQRSDERALRYYAQGEWARALQGFQDSLRWAEMADDRPAMAGQALNVGMVALALDDLALAEQAFQQAERVADEQGDSGIRRRARLGLARVDLRRDRYAAARSEFAEVLSEARQHLDIPAMLVALNGLGLARKGLGDADAARRDWREAEELARAAGEPRLLAATLANRAALELQTGDVDQAVPRLEEAVTLDRELENLAGLAHDLALLAWARRLQGDLSSGLELYRQARTIAGHVGQSAWVERYDREIARLEHESNAPLQRRQVESLE